MARPGRRAGHAALTALRLADGHPAAVCSDQVLPFQVSATGDTTPVAVGLLAPTAEQNVAEVHDTEKSALNVAGLGAATLVQVVPFHWAASVVSAVLDPVLPAPTAIQAVVAGQATLCRKVSGCGSAGDSSDQAFPFQCAASALPGKG